MGAARFEVVAGKAVGTTILVEDELLIGRQADGPGRLADDDEISRSHARVSVDTGGFCAIEDLGSTNGTFVNGLRISSPQTVSEGDTIEIGGTTLVVKEVGGPGEQEPGAPERPQPTVGAGTVRGENVGPSAPVLAPPPPVTAEVPPSNAPPDQPPPADPSQRTPSVPRLPRLPEVPVLSLQLEVDFDAREARLFLDRASEPLRLVFDAGNWRVDSSPVTEKGSPHERRTDRA